MVKRPQRPNLFFIDPDAIRAQLELSNAVLRSRAEDWLKGIDENFGCIENSSTKEIEIAARSTKSLLQDVRDARLSDSATFRQAVKIVDNYHQQTERRLKDVFDLLASALRDRTAAQSAGTINPPPTPVVATNGGVAIHTVATAGSQANPPLAWSVKAVSRDEVDLEALRPFLTDHALLTAARTHLRETQQRNVTGVIYEQVVRI